ncbi:hypothetical protein NLX86_00245 [Streptomyces sp. A3M-1-3]|uniref:hypothetical protein n=1 Tax=Streptomyces sp. A3M-1-3 TaxID=2962044 RepID=UPI0020B77F49|nr:hypothetical protein [Streptomyces sp. A3M-1-3]MCP3816621.1 hypothetical protein [Streptomyces sp. A3M-1-3]
MSGRELRDPAEIVDALYRFGLGQDLKGRDLFASSFTGLFEGRVDTTHTVADPVSRSISSATASAGG